MSVSGSDSSLASQCLAFCQMLASQGKAFSLSLKIDTHFSFSMDTQETGKKDPPIQARKKLSPSTVRRNARRRQNFLEAKQNTAKQTGTTSAESSKNLKCDVCDFVFKSRKELNIHMVKDHAVLEQLDGNVSMNSTDDEEDTKETNRETERLETEVDFLIQFKKSKTKEEVSSELGKLWDSELKVDIGWNIVLICETFFIIQIQLEEGESMNQLLDTISWPTDCTHISTYLKKLVFHICDA